MSLGHRSSNGFVKKGYTTREEAQQRADFRNAKCPEDHRVVYQCPDPACGEWHVGRPPGLISNRDKAIVEFVAQYRAEHDTGPTWKEVWEGTGNPPLKRVWGQPTPKTYQDFTIRLRALAKAGWLKFTKETRSLDIGRRAKRKVAA